MNENSFINQSAGDGTPLSLRKPFLFSCIILFAYFWFAHFSLSRSYKMGLEMTLAAGGFYAVVTLLFLWLGFRNQNQALKNIFGLCAGLSWWLVFGEIGDTLEAEFHVTTGIGIGYGNIPFLVVLGLIFLMALRQKAISDDTVLQWANFAYLNWLGHVVLLTVYYAPIFGGATPHLGATDNCWEIWSTPRLTAAIVIWAIYLVILIPLVLFKLRKSPDIRLKVASAFWFVILFWSVFVEIPKKLIYFRLW